MNDAMIRRLGVAACHLRARGLRLAQRWLHDASTRLDGYLDQPAKGDPRSRSGHPLALPAHSDATSEHRLPPPGPDARFEVYCQHSRERLNALVRRGYHIGPACYGYTLDRFTVTDETGRLRHRCRLVPLAEQVEIVKRIFTWRAVECWSPARITGELHRRFPPPPSRNPERTGVWRVDRVERILTNFRYTGYQARGYRADDGSLKPRNEWITSDQPAHWTIITEELFWAAQNPTPQSARALKQRLRLHSGEEPPWA